MGRRSDLEKLFIDDEAVEDNEAEDEEAEAIIHRGVRSHSGTEDDDDESDAGSLNSFIVSDTEDGPELHPVHPPVVPHMTSKKQQQHPKAFTSDGILMFNEFAKCPGSNVSVVLQDGFGGDLEIEPKQVMKTAKPGKYIRTQRCYSRKSRKQRSDYAVVSRFEVRQTTQKIKVGNDVLIAPAKEWITRHMIVPLAAILNSPTVKSHTACVPKTKAEVPKILPAEQVVSRAELATDSDHFSADQVETQKTETIRSDATATADATTTPIVYDEVVRGVGDVATGGLFTADVHVDSEPSSEVEELSNNDLSTSRPVEAGSLKKYKNIRKRPSSEPVVESAPDAASLEEVEEPSDEIPVFDFTSPRGKRRRMVSLGYRRESVKDRRRLATDLIDKYGTLPRGWHLFEWRSDRLKRFQHIVRHTRREILMKAALAGYTYVHDVEGQLCDA